MGSSTKTKSSSTAAVATAEGQQQAQQQVNALQKQIAALEKQQKSQVNVVSTNPFGAGYLQQIQSQQQGSNSRLDSLRQQLAQAQKALSLQSGAIGISDAEKQGLQAQTQGLTDLQSMINQGPGAQDVQGALDSQRQFAQMLEQYQNGGFLPGQGDITQARGLVDQLFAGQQTALQQQLDQQKKMAQRNAALSGRGINDPIFQNQLAQSQLQQQQLLQSQMTSATAEQAQNLPLQRLQFAEAATNARLGLGNQAMQNRQLLLQLGNTLREQERNFRLNAGNKNNSATQVTKSNPGALGIISGIAGGIGAIGSGLSSLHAAGGLGNILGLGSGAQPMNVGGAQGFDPFNGGTVLAAQGIGGNRGPASVLPGASASSPSADLLSQIQGANTGLPSWMNGPTFNQAFNQGVTNSTPAYATPAYSTSGLWNSAQNSNMAADLRNQGIANWYNMRNRGQY